MTMLGNIEIQKMSFHQVCNKEEIERIFNIQNASDYLLKLRADTIVDNMRLFRVYRNKALTDPKNWSLEKSFDSKHYDGFLRSISSEKRTTCSRITFGNIFSTDPNGLIFQTDYGPIITICDSLRFFLKFSHLALLGLHNNVPSHVRLNSLRIAIRVMLKTETLDFLMDPRGIIPADIEKAINAHIPLQLQFIAGHEFAHYICGHLSESKVSTKPIYFAASSKFQDYKPSTVYNNSQAQEIEADVHSILLPRLSKRKKRDLLGATLLWFGCLELYEAVCAVLCLTSPWDPQSHPTARDRFKNLLSEFSVQLQMDKSVWDRFQSMIDEYKEVLLKDVAINTEGYEIYGSAYLDEPNTEWRGKELKDRIDYY